MSRDIWAEIEDKASEHGFMTGTERSRERINETAEVFTPTELVISMLKKIPTEQYGPGKLVIDPACGDGQFLVAVKWAKVLIHGMTEEDALEDLYGIDLMRDNVELCRRRLGGGTIVLGDALNPQKKLPEQTGEEAELMAALFELSPVPEPLFG